LLIPRVKKAQEALSVATCEIKNCVAGFSVENPWWQCAGELVGWWAVTSTGAEPLNLFRVAAKGRGVGVAKMKRQINKTGRTEQ